MIGIIFAAVISAQAIETCKTVETLAYDAAMANQRGVPASTIMKAMGDNAIAQSIAIDVIAMRRYSTEKYQDKAARSYATEAASICFKNLTGSKS